MDAAIRRIQAAGEALLALDFDGTLAPIVQRPEHAILPKQTAAILRDLNASEEVTLAIVSGRSISDLRQRLGLECIYAGNHGLEIEGRGISFVHPQAAILRPVLLCACRDLDAAIAGIDGAFVERKELSATVHYRQTPAPLHDRLGRMVFRALKPFANCLDLFPARKAWEVRPRVAWNKGAAIEFLLGRMCCRRPLVICAGDDATDEHMFSAAADGISIRVGSPSDTGARYSVADPAELAVFLARLRSVWTGMVSCRADGERSVRSA
jgi:trehalose-phosphatase